MKADLITELDFITHNITFLFIDLNLKQFVNYKYKCKHKPSFRRSLTSSCQWQEPRKRENQLTSLRGQKLIMCRQPKLISARWKAPPDGWPLKVKGTYSHVMTAPTDQLIRKVTTADGTSPTQKHAENLTISTSSQARSAVPVVIKLSRGV